MVWGSWFYVRFFAKVHILQMNAYFHGKTSHTTSQTTPAMADNHARGYCEWGWSFETSPWWHLFFVMTWATLLSIKASRNSLISWSGDLYKVKTRPFFGLLNLCCEWRSEELFENVTHSWHQECVRKLLEHRFWVSSGVFWVMASDFE